ncbi:MAG: esterase [Acidobacteriaceae bacterium]
MKISISFFSCLCAALLALCYPSAAESKPKSPEHKLRFEISIAAAEASQPLDGRMMLAISKAEKPEPRFAISEQEAESQQFFALDVEGAKTGAPVVIDGGALGYPVRSLEQLPAGDYYVQAVLNIYETFHRADGHVVKLPPEMGEGQQWNRKPGNLYSKPEKVHVDPAAGGVVRINLTEKIAPIAPKPDTKYVKHFSLQSKLLSQFWGRSMQLGAIVVLPEGFDEHPQAHYPVVVFQGHFPADFTFRMEPPMPEMKGAERDAAEYSYKLYQDWTSGRLPKMILLEIQHANPYYDDSYAVNSENLGPYGDAIVKELLPEVERRYRGIGQPWARALIGGSTGGWEAIADQVFYPDDFNGAWGFCPDPVDFHAYQSVNIYEDKNAFWAEGPFGKVPRAEMRNPSGTLLATMEPAVRREEVMGTHGRSTEQFGVWQAVFSPVGADGYPAPIWDPVTGVIDAKVADYWRDHYDLDHIMQRDWATLGPKLAGKLHITVGDMDTWYLNNAVHLMQDFLDSPKNPYRVADFEYGYLQPHCYTGGGVSMEAKRTMLQRTLPQVAEHMKKTAPADADKSWRY